MAGSSPQPQGGIKQGPLSGEAVLGREQRASSAPEPREPRGLLSPSLALVTTAAVHSKSKRLHEKAHHNFPRNGVH